MSVHYLEKKKRWFSKWRENGREKRRYFATEQEARPMNRKDWQAIMKMKKG